MGPALGIGGIDMSFVRTLATLAMGIAAAKGYDKYKQSGGMAGVQDALKNNPQTAALGKQAEDMLKKFGIGGGNAAGAAGGGMGGLAGMLGGLTAAASAGVTGMLDQLTGTTTATDTAEANARLMIRAMIQAARADGTIDAAERAAIMKHLTDATDEERAYVEEQMQAPVDALALARDTADALKGQVYSAAAMTVRTEGSAEAQFLKALAQGLGLDQATVAGIHLSLGKAAPLA